MSSPVIQIYDMSDVEAQELVLGLLQDWQGVAARPAFNGPDRYVVIECADSARAQSIFTMVTSVDPSATLIHSTNGDAPLFDERPLEPTTTDTADVVPRR